MTRYLLISGSPRNGNTDYALQRIYDGINGGKGIDKEIIHLRDMDIKHCIGCCVCHKTNECVIDDDMSTILDKVRDADVLVLGTPNYFDNVTGITKDFIDRTHPCYTDESLKGKKIFLVMVGGEKVAGTRKYLAETTFGFVTYQKLQLLGSYCFRADASDDLENDEDAQERLDEMIADISKL